jgi:S1-C subfamily serine protease
VEVVQVVEGSPADRAGLRPEDLIVSIDGGAISTVDELHKLMVSDVIGRTLHVSLIREGQRVDVDLVPAELES